MSFKQLGNLISDRVATKIRREVNEANPVMTVTGTVPKTPRYVR
jgi:hypothetical protein